MMSFTVVVMLLINYISSIIRATQKQKQQQSQSQSQGQSQSQSQTVQINIEKRIINLEEMVSQLYSDFESEMFVKENLDKTMFYSEKLEDSETNQKIFEILFF